MQLLNSSFTYCVKMELDESASVERLISQISKKTSTIICNFDYFCKESNTIRYD